MAAGNVILFVGVCGVLASFVMSGGRSVSGAFSWGNDHRNLLLGVSMGLIAIGLKQIRKGGQPADGWKASAPGARFQRVIVYSREGCGLCDEAMEVLQRYSRYFNDLSEISIAESEELTEKYGTTIPVVEIDGEVRFQGRVNEVLLRRLIEGTEPLV